MIDKFISSRQIATPRKSQMTKVIHSDFLTVAESMTSAFSTIENNQARDLMPSLVPELGLCLHMLQMELNLHCIELGYEKS
ncbi:hypothetical protein [Prochlorococcus marinus]|uniref:hypothetical protein n=1 Tax=Prochlorococcus marinus TaxID=1219 RepID=UPI0022B3AD34|nr:hypothetical protein [Prochlorococcus marinus]